MRTRTTHTKIAAALLVVLFTALTSTAVLAYFIYDRTLSGLVGSRFEFIAKDLKEQVESGLDLGLPLGELDNVKTLLRQHLSTDDALVALGIVNARGIVLVDTDDARVGERVPVEWLEAKDASTAKNPIVISKEQFGVPLVTNYGKVVGALLLTVSHAHYAAKRLQTAQSLFELTLIIFLVGSVIGIFGILAISQPLVYVVMRLEAGLRSMLLRVGGTVDLPSADSDVENDILAFERNVFTAVDAIEQLENGRTRIDAP